jgi:hypothetical protein
MHPCTDCQKKREKEKKRNRTPFLFIGAFLQVRCANWQGKEKKEPSLSIGGGGGGVFFLGIKNGPKKGPKKTATSEKRNCFSEMALLRVVKQTVIKRGGEEKKRGKKRTLVSLSSSVF